MAVTTIDSVSSLLSELRHHQLLESQQLGEIAPARFADVRSLAQHLVQQGWLTAFQVNHLIQNRGRDLVIGPYLLLDRLGEGATGQVYKARHRRLNRLAAVKVIRPELMTQPDAVGRFYREVQVTGRLSHPNIVEAYDAGPVGRSHFFAMEYIEGTDFDRLVKQRGPLPVREACEFLRQAALGLKHAHAHGLVHRDIKPSNLMLTKGPGGVVVKILDLGLVHMSQGTAASLAATLTESGSMLGTPDFMAPEQAENTHQVDTRADIYSLGGTLYFLLAGKVPFPNCSLMQKLLKLQTAEPTPVERVRLDTPPALAGLVRAMMAKKPKDRVQTCAEVIGGLEGIVKGLGRSAGSTISNIKLPGAARQTHPTMRWSSILMAPPRLALKAVSNRAGGRQRRWRIVGGGVAACLGMILVLSFLLGGNSAQINSDWQRIEGLAKESNSDPDGLRAELLGFRARHPGNQYSLRAAEMLAELPSPLDRLGPGQIPAEEQLPGLPRDVVAVIGKHRLPLTGTRLIAYSPNDQMVASLGGPTGTILQLWSLHTGEMRATWNVSTGLTAAAVAPGGRQMATAGPDNVVRLWDVATGKERAALEGHSRTITNLAFTANGQQLASGGADNLVKLWDVAAARETGTLTTPAMVRGLVFTADGATLASIGLDRVIRLWDLATSQQRGTVTLPTTVTVTGLAFSPDGKLLALSGGDQTVRIFNATTGQERSVFKGHTQPVHLITFSPDGQTVASAGYDRSVRLWSVTGKELGVFPGHPQMPMLLLGFGSDGKTVTMATQDMTVWEWEVGRRAPVVVRGHADWRTAAAPAPDERSVATGSRSGLVCLWDPSSREVRVSFHAHPQAITALAFAPDGKVLATAGHDRAARLWDAATGKPLATLAAHDQAVTALAYSPDGKTLASASIDQTIKLFTADGSERRSLRGHQGAVRLVAFAPDARTLLSGGDDGTVRTWDTSSGQLQQSLSVAPRGVRALALAATGQLATAEEGETAVRLWAGPPGRFQPGAQLSGHTASVQALDFTPDGALLASGDQDGRIVLWKAPAGQKQQEWLLSTGPVQSLRFAEDGRHLVATSANGTVYLLRRSR